MIAFVRGKLAQLDPTFAIVDCGGVGYLVRISLNTYSHLRGQEEVRLFTYLQVREDAHVLYGFSRQEEQSLFELLISVSGVGGNTALVILSSIPPDDLRLAIASGDELGLKRIKGIGPKTAARIVLELRDKAGVGVPDTAGQRQPGDQSRRRQEALAALMTLGMPKPEMEKRLDKILQEQGSDLPVEQLVKLALRNN
ncbi:MAG: Holliday junction branch migration protein RuvA [Bacteroidia bacterium]|nr:Holliday junction branch migration protein RuvA [Bacteroidia bacterium]